MRKTHKQQTAIKIALRVFNILSNKCNTFSDEYSIVFFSLLIDQASYFASGDISVTSEGILGNIRHLSEHC